MAKGKTTTQLKENILRDFKATRDYLINHKMVINEAKTQLMYLHPKEELEELNLTFEGNIIKHQKSIKILGVTISQDAKNILGKEKDRSQKV